MTRFVLLCAVIVIVGGATAIMAGRMIDFAETPKETVASRFPEGTGSAPVFEYKKPLALPSAVSQMSTDEYIAAVTAVEQLRPPPRPPQPANAVFNDAQIANIKHRLELTEQQVPYWLAVEASLREVAWDRSRGIRPRLESSSLERLKQAAAPFVATLDAKQRSKIAPLANIVGLRLNDQVP